MRWFNINAAVVLKIIINKLLSDENNAWLSAHDDILILNNQQLIT